MMRVFRPDVRDEIWIAKFLFEVQQRAPDEIGGETAEQHHHQLRQTGPQGLGDGGG
ncbi:MAG: hypothetical protein ABSD28_13740 [Tepidisphaeraceae bacterium]|jgi:hypothetical protein